jgi:hypothetical protein
MYLNLPFWAFQIAAGSQTFPSAKDSHVSECRPLSHYVCTFIVLKYRHMRVHSSLTLKHCASKHATHQSVYMHTHSQTFMYVCMCVFVCVVCVSVCARAYRVDLRIHAHRRFPNRRIHVFAYVHYPHTSIHPHIQTQQPSRGNTHRHPPHDPSPHAPPPPHATTPPPLQTPLSRSTPTPAPAIDLPRISAPANSNHPCNSFP